MTKKAKKLGVKISKPATDGVETISDEDLKDSNDESNVPNDKKEDLHKVCGLLDKLTLDMLILMEKNIQQKQNIETCMTDGEHNLAKSRYIMGHKNVSSLQLPLESNVDIEPVITVTENHDEEYLLEKPQLSLDIKEIVPRIKKDKTENSSESEGDEEENNSVQDPIKWFGFLVPGVLHQAKEQFRKALEWVVDCTNTQIRLSQTYIKILQLRKYKNEILQN